MMILVNMVILMIEVNLVILVTTANSGESDDFLEFNNSVGSGKPGSGSGKPDLSDSGDSDESRDSGECGDSGDPD